MSTTNIVHRRLEIFKHFDRMDNPTLSITTLLDIGTNNVNNSKLMASILHAVNSVDNFRLRIGCAGLDNPMFLYSNIGLGFTVPTRDEVNSFKFAIAEYDEDINKTCTNIYSAIRQAAKRESFYCDGGMRKDLIYLSYVPYADITSTQQPFCRHTCDIPSFIVGQLNKDGKIPISVTAHHGLVDAYHLGIFFEELVNNLTK